ncbi:MAG TPA: hypothetical protein VMC09_12310 [Anaerolineales bacterium]|nr:hypothetical protein [Anaerolineales bacterium]
MNWRLYLLLAALGLAVGVLAAAFQPAPGYMDADYYYAGGLQLVRGHGFTEPYLWNYLDDPAGLPHPSNAYWMPLASLLAAAGAALFGPGSWSAARAGFLAVFACLPPLTAALAWRLTSRRDLGLTAGLLAVFPAFYLPLTTTTDTFGLYMLLGGCFFLVLYRRTSFLTPLLLGLLAGLMHLARADGLLWLLLAFLAVWFILPKAARSTTFYFSILTLAGYLLVMAPWFIRNLNAFGTPLAPGGSKMLWLTSYDQLFAYPAGQVTSTAWWQSGLPDILRARLWAFGLNLANALSVQGEVFLLPLIGIGAWHLRKDRRILLAGLAWLLTLGAMTVAFPFAGARGGFLHSGAAVQIVWWALAPIGLDRLIAWGVRRRGWAAGLASRLFQGALVTLAVLLTAAVFWGRILGGSGGQPWGQENAAYQQMDDFLVNQGLLSGDVVMVANPPGFSLVSGNSAIAVPDGSVETLLDAAQRYNAIYLILEQGSTPSELLSTYQQPTANPDLIYLGEVAHARIFLIRHH